MTKVNAEAIRPGTTFQAWEKVWRVLKNDTLNRQMVLEDEDGFGKVLRYAPGITINCRSVPYYRI